MSLASHLRRALPPAPEVVRSLAVALLLGTIMNGLGHLLGLAHFRHWWQVVTCYGAYVLPVAILLRRLPARDQLLWGLVSMVPLELAGYALGTSVAGPDNWLDPLLGERNFALAMVVLCAPTPWLVNTLAGGLRPEGRSFGRSEDRPLQDESPAGQSPSPNASPVAAGLQTGRSPLSRP